MGGGSDEASIPYEGGWGVGTGGKDEALSP